MLYLHTLATGIAAHIIELRRRNTHGKGQHTIDRLQHLCLPLFKGSRFGALGLLVTQLQPKLLQLQPDEVGHLAGMFAAISLGHGLFRH